MQRNDVEFWNGVFKGTLLAEETVKEIAQSNPGINRETMAVVEKKLSELEERLKHLHTHGIREALERIPIR